MTDIDTLGQTAIIIFVVAFLICFLIMAALLWIGWWVTARQGSVSPYTKKTMALGEDMAAGTANEIKNYFLRMDPIDNPVFDLKFAAICKETGRVFPNCVNHFGVIRLDWSFLDKRYQGKWLSWGSLTPIQQADVRSCHDTMEGFQTEVSCTNPFPKNIDSFHAMTKPGPLYVDLSTMILLGWKCLPGTTLELLVVQRPYYTHVNEDHANYTT